MYLGEHDITLRSTSKTLLDTEYFHIFKNDYSFLNLEEKFSQRGGVDGATTLYLFREILPSQDEEENGSSEKANSVWQLAGVVTKYRN